MQLILNTYGASLRRKDKMFQVKAGERKFLMSPRKVQTIWLATGVVLSTDAIRLALEHHVDIALLDKHGQPYGRFWHNRLGSTNLLRRRLLEIAETEDGVALAAEWTQTKIGHQAGLLRELARTRPDRTESLEAAAGRLDKMADIVAGLRGDAVDELRGSLMGLEGVAGREYFAGLSLALPERFRFQGRSRSPAKDEFNCLLNYAYGVLYSLVERGLPALRARPMHRADAHRQLQQTLARLRPDRAFPRPRRARRRQPVRRPEGQAGTIRPGRWRIPAQRRGPCTPSGRAQRPSRPDQTTRQTPAQASRHDRLRVPAPGRPTAPRPRPTIEVDMSVFDLAASSRIPGSVLAGERTPCAGEAAAARAPTGPITALNLRTVT